MKNARCNCAAWFEISIDSPTPTTLYSGMSSYTYSPEDSTCSLQTVSESITGKKGLTSIFTFQPKYAIQKESSVHFKFTKWFSDMSEGIYNDFITSPGFKSCSYIADASQTALYNPSFTCQLSVAEQSIQFNTLNALDFPQTQNYQLKLTQYRNPFSTMPETINLWILEKIDGFLELKESCTYTTTAVTPVQFTYVSTPTTPQSGISVTQTINFAGTTNTPFNAASTFLRVTYDAPLVITYPPTAATGSVQGARMQLDIPNFVASNKGTGSSYNFNLSVKSPPYARTNSIKFEIMYKKDASNIYTQEQILSEYTFITVAGPLTATLVTIADPTISVITDYTFKITVNTSYSAGSKLYFMFPSTNFALASPSCSWVSGSMINNSLTCTQASLAANEIESQNIILGTLVAGDTFEIKIKNVQNPPTTALSDFIKIQTRTSTGNVIEENMLIQVSAQPKLLNAVLSSYNSKIVYSSTTITFEIIPDIIIPANGVIELVFPTDLTYSTNPTLTNPVNLGGTTLSGVYPTLQIKTATALPVGTNFSFTLVGVTNPTSFKQTGSFIISTKDASNVVIQKKSTGLTMTMNQRAATTNVLITPTSQFTGVNNVDYNFKITLKVPHTGTNMFTIVFPTEIQLNSSISCSTVIGLTAITCTKSSNTIKASVTFGTFPADYIVSFVVSNANNYLISGVYVFQFTSDTNLGDAIEGNTSINYTLKPSSFTSVTGTNLQTVMTRTDNIYQLTINPKSTLPGNLSSSNTSVDITLPSQVNIMGSSVCQMISPTSITCTNDIVNKKFVCAPAGSFDQPIVIKMTNIGFNYIATGQSDSLIVSTSYSGNPIDQASSGLQLVHNCDPNCYQCTPTQSAICSSCFSSALTINNLLQVNKCKDICDPGYVALTGNSVCQPCQNNCATCITNQITCQSCSGNFFLEGTNCVSTCQPGYYGDKTSNTCQKCSFPCETCELTSSYCLTCQNNVSNSVNIYSYKGTCVASCPVDVSVLSGNQCLPCATNCIKCQNDPNNCLLCKDTYNLSGSVCVAVCPTSTYPNGGKCLSCFSPCTTCSTGPSYCTSCNSPYYVYNGTCVNAPCPNGTYQVDANRSCNSCPKGCSACNSLTECTLCDTASGYTVLYNKQCLTQCPQDKPFQTSTGCEECGSNCLTCKTSKDYCTSCNSSLFLYSGKCLSECPSGYVKDTSTNTCENPQTKETRIYFPYLIGACIFLAVTGASKIMAKQSQFFTNATAFTSIFEFLSWLTTGILMFNYNTTYDDDDIRTALGVFWFGFILYVITNIVAFFYIKKKFLTDIKFQTWRLQSTGHQHSTKFIQVFTLIFSFKFFRFIYGRFLNRSYLSARFLENDVVFKPTNFLSILSYLLSSILIIAGAAIACYETQLIQDNLYYFSIEAIILTLIMLFLILADIFKESDYFTHDLHLDKKSRVYVDDGSAKKDPLMSMDVRNELEKNVLEKSLAYDRLNNSNLNNTNALLKQRSKNGQTSLQEIEAADLNESSLYNSMLNSQHRIKKAQNEMIVEEDGDESNRPKKNGKGMNSSTNKLANKNSNILSPSNTDRYGGQAGGIMNGDKSKRSNSSENMTASKILANQSTQTNPAALGSQKIGKDSTKNGKKSQSSLKNLNKKNSNSKSPDRGDVSKSKINSQSPDKNDKSQQNGAIQASSRSPTNNLNKTGSKVLDSTKKLSNEDGDQILNGKDCHHLIRVYDKNGNSNSKPNLNSTNNNVSPSSRSPNNSKSPSKTNKKKGQNSSTKKNGINGKGGKSKQNTQGLIGQEDEEVESTYNPTDGGRQFNGLKNLKTHDSKDIYSNNSNNNANGISNSNGGVNPYDVNGYNPAIEKGANKHKTPKKPRNILDDTSGQYDEGDSESENSIIQDTPSNYNYLNMRFESKDLLNMQAVKPYNNNLLASTGMKTLPVSNTSPLNYGAPSPLDPGYSTSTSQIQQNSGLKGPIKNQFFSPLESPGRQSQTLRLSGNNTLNSNKNGPKKQLSITPTNYNYGRNNSPTKNNGNTYSVTPTSNTFANNGQNVMKTHSDYEEGIKISKILEQESQKKMLTGGQPFFMTQKLTQSDKQKQDYLDNYDYSIPQTTMNANNNNQNEFFTEASKGRSGSNPKSKMKSNSRAMKTLESDPKVKQLEDIYNQKLVPFQNNRQSSNQQSQSSSIKGNKKGINGLTIIDPANFSDYEVDANPGYF